MRPLEADVTQTRLDDPDGGAAVDNDADPPQAAWQDEETLVAIDDPDEPGTDVDEEAGGSRQRVAAKPDERPPGARSEAPRQPPPAGPRNEGLTHHEQERRSR
jgi:hypothetical protein